MSDLDRAEQLAARIRDPREAHLAREVADMLSALVARVRELEHSWEPGENYPLGDDQPDLAGRRLDQWARSEFGDSHAGLAQQVKACAWVVLKERAVLVARVRALTDAGNGLAGCVERTIPAYPARLTTHHALDAWRALVDTAPNPTTTNTPPEESP